MTDNSNLYAHFEQNFPADLDTQLLLTADGRNVTYAEAAAASARIANTLLQFGAIRGDRITVQVVDDTGRAGSFTKHLIRHR